MEICDVMCFGEVDWSGVVGRVLGWVVGLASARTTFNTGMFMIKLLPEHNIVYNSTKFFIDLASSFCCQVHQIDALNFKMCKMFLYSGENKYLNPCRFRKFGHLQRNV